MQKRIIKLSSAVVILATAGLLYYVIHNRTGFAIYCPVHLITGFDCPGCGVTRMLFAMLEFDFKSAMDYNAAIFLTLPVLAVVGVSKTYDYIRYGRNMQRKWVEFILYCLIVIYVGFAILRNIPYFEYLAA